MAFLSCIIKQINFRFIAAHEASYKKFPIISWIIVSVIKSTVISRDIFNFFIFIICNYFMVYNIKNEKYL